MRVVTLLVFLATVVFVECTHTFMGTNVYQHMIYHHNVQYNSKIFRKRVENLYFSMPTVPSNAQRAIQGILAYDMTHSDASANVTQGGIGYKFVNLRMKSARGGQIHFDVYIFA